MATATKTINEVAKNFRRTSAGVQLGRQLFDSSYQQKITTAQIASLLQKAGLPITNEMRVSAASAQIIIAGGSFVEKAQLAGDIKGFLAPAKSIIDGTLELLDAIGLMSKKEPAAKGMSFLGSAAMVMASGGLNIIANIAFVMEIIGFLLTQDEPVDMVKVHNELLKQSVEKVRNNLIARQKMQSAAAASLFTGYQNGRVSVFQMLGGVASTAPDLFLKYFPDFQAFIPFTSERVCETSTKMVYVPASDGANAAFTRAYDLIDSGKWPELNAARFPYGALKSKDGSFQSASQDDYRRYGNGVTQWINASWQYIPLAAYQGINTERVVYVNERRTNTDKDRFITAEETFCYELATIRKYQKSELQQIFLEKYVAKPFAPYAFIASMNKERLQTYGYPPDSGVDYHPNPVYPRIALDDLAIISMLPPYFSQLGSTFDLTRFLIALNITPNDMGYSNWGEEYLQYSDISNYQVQQAQAGVTFNGVDYWTPAQAETNRKISTNNGNIRAAVDFDNAGDMVSLSRIPNAKKVMKEFGTLPWLPPEAYGSIFENSNPLERDYRNIQNYWAAVSVFEGIRNDPYFEDAKGLSLYRELDNAFPRMDELEAKHKKLQFLSTSRRLNEDARKNIAMFMGEPDHTKLNFAPVEEGKLAVVIQPPITVRGTTK